MLLEYPLAFPSRQLFSSDCTAASLANGRLTPVGATAYQLADAGRSPLRSPAQRPSR